MASRRIAWLMAPPLARRPCRPRRPSGGAFGPVAADVPAPHCAISDRVEAREGFHGRPPKAPSVPPDGECRECRSSLYDDASYSSFIIQRRIFSIAVVDGVGIKPGPARRPADFLSAPPQLGRALRQS